MAALTCKDFSNSTITDTDRKNCMALVRAVSVPPRTMISPLQTRLDLLECTSARPTMDGKLGSIYSDWGHRCLLFFKGCDSMAATRCVSDSTVQSGT